MCASRPIGDAFVSESENAACLEDVLNFGRFPPGARVLPRIHAAIRQDCDYSPQFKTIYTVSLLRKRNSKHCLTVDFNSLDAMHMSDHGRLPMLKIENSETGRNCLISLKMNEKMGGSTIRECSHYLSYRENSSVSVRNLRSGALFDTGTPEPPSRFSVHVVGVPLRAARLRE